MPALVHFQGQEQTHACLDYIKASVTICCGSLGGMDVDIALLVKLKRFIKEQCIIGLCFVERVGVLTHKHFRMMVKGNFASLLVLNKIIIVCLGWDEIMPTCHVASYKN